MSVSTKNRPPNLPDGVKWMVCRDCDFGIEVMDNMEANSIDEIQFEETITMTQYITIRKTPNGVTKSRYSDPERTILLGEEKLG